MKQATISRKAAPEKDAYLAAIAELQAEDQGRSPAWLARIRNSAAERFQRVGFPTTHDEDWKYTNVAPIVRTQFETALEPPARAPSADEVDRLAACGAGAARLVFVDGHYLADLSLVPAGLRPVVSLARAIVDRADEVEAHLARYVSPSESAFAALNTALIQDGAFVFIPRGVIVDEPIELLFLSSSMERPTASHPRALIVLETGSAATVVETYASLGGEPHFTNAVVEIVLGEGASLTHRRILEESERTFHIGTIEVHESRDSVYTSLNVAAGPELARNGLNVRLTGPGASCSLNGLTVSRSSQHVDNHTLIDHATPHGTSRQLYKGVLDDTSRTVFNGKILVRPGAQATDAQQSNRNLLLSSQATLDTKPQLEILADDVRCTHGATVGQLDEDMVFYLKSRGLGDDASRAILTYAFASEVVESVGEVSVRSHVERLIARALSTSLPNGHALTLTLSQRERGQVGVAEPWTDQ